MARRLLEMSFDPVAGKWRTILVGGLNSGGRGYYALDVTDPNNPIALWEFAVRDTASCPSITVLGVDKTDCDLGLTYGNPVISKLTNGDWVVMVTSGYNNTSPGDGKGYLYVLDPITGVIEKKIKAANATQGIDPGSTTTPRDWPRSTTGSMSRTPTTPRCVSMGGDLPWQSVAYRPEHRYGLRAGTAYRRTGSTTCRGPVRDHEAGIG